MEKKEYRVLIVDDKKDCLEMTDIISRSYKDWNIEINPVHIQVEKIDDDNYSIAMESISEIANLSVQPFDLILLDFGYRHKDLELMTIFEKCRDSKYNFKKYMLDPHTLVTQGRKYLDNNSFQNFNKNFVCFNKNIHVYTYNPTIAREFMPDVDNYCTNRVQTAFEAATIKVHDTRRELFNDIKFEEVKKNNEDYYYFILAKYLENLIRLEISNNIIDKEISDKTYIKIKRSSTVTVIGSLVLLCSLLGACTQFFGGLIVELFQKRDLLTAFVFFFFTLIIIILGGRLVLYVIENILPKLLKKND